MNKPVEPVEVRRRDKAINFRITEEELTALQEVAKELDFPYTTLCRRIVKQFIREHLAKKAADLAAQN